MFGNNIDKTAEDLARDLAGQRQKDKARTKKILADLVTLARDLDPNGHSKDFTKRKSFNYYDPMNIDGGLIESGLRFQGLGEGKVQESLIVALHSEHLNKLHADVKEFGSDSDKQIFAHIEMMV